MCTVSFIHSGNNIIITSNRDENINRPVTSAISLLHHKEQSLFFPKDPAQGGTWFVVTNKKRAAVLLNGAFEKHIPSYPYIKSRGLILLELIQENSISQSFETLSLDGIEPFTIIAYEQDKLMELRWDGKVNHIKQLCANQPYIWSSATLYDAGIRKWREKIFTKFLSQTAFITEKEIKDFHLQSCPDTENGFLMKRSNGIQTRSLTQAILSPGNSHLHHYMIDTKTNTHTTIPIVS